MWQEDEDKYIYIFSRCFCSPPVRRASANVVSIVAKYAVPAGEWPDLLPFLFQCSQSAQEEHREVISIEFRKRPFFCCILSIIPPFNSSAKIRRHNAHWMYVYHLMHEGVISD